MCLFCCEIRTCACRFFWWGLARIPDVISNWTKGRLHFHWTPIPDTPCMEYSWWFDMICLHWPMYVNTPPHMECLCIAKRTPVGHAGWRVYQCGHAAVLGEWQEGAAQFPVICLALLRIFLSFPKWVNPFLENIGLIWQYVFLGFWTANARSQRAAFWRIGGAHYALTYRD